MKCGINWIAVFAVCTFVGRFLDTQVVVEARILDEATVKVLRASTDEKSQTTTLVVQASHMKDKRWRSLFIHPGYDLKFPTLHGTLGGATVVSPSSGKQQNWLVRRYRAGAVLGIHAGAGESAPGGFGDGQFELTIHWDKKTFPMARTRGVTWYATKNGKRSADFVSNDLINHCGGVAPVTFPQALLSLRLSDDDNEILKVKSGSSSSIQIDSDKLFSGMAYKVYTSTEIAESFDDPLSIGIRWKAAPIPKSWAVELKRGSGRLSQGGKSNPTIEVELSDNDELVGKKIYLVLVIKEKGRGILYSSDPKVLQIVRK